MRHGLPRRNEFGNVNSRADICTALTRFPGGLLIGPGWTETPSRIYLETRQQPSPIARDHGLATRQSHKPPAVARWHLASNGHVLRVRGKVSVNAGLHRPRIRLVLKSHIKASLLTCNCSILFYTSCPFLNCSVSYVLHLLAYSYLSGPPID